MATKPAKGTETASEAPQYFRFLDLSPELRNRVYGYAKEDDANRFAPQPRRHLSGASRKGYAERTWGFFALTQTCSQIRAEYRPLWVQHLRVALMSTHQLANFLDTFLQSENEPKHVPKLVQFLWDHGHDNGMIFDLTRILRLHSHSPSLQLEFVPENVALGQTVDEDMCHNCMMRYHREERGLDPDSDDDDCDCPPLDMSNSAWKEFKETQMEYTSDIPEFVHNTNEAWMTAVKEDKVTVTCSFCQWSHHAIFKILYKDPVCETTTDSQPAWDLLKQWGILDLQVKRATHLILAYEEDQTMDHDGYRMINSVKRQVLIRKVPSTS
ncbi:hypothetical protein J4E91_007023 [Alternaria rosae]|nr:hypothetical protein J4E91_007023 [Alternaria rosae]